VSLKTGTEWSPGIASGSHGEAESTTVAGAVKADSQSNLLDTQSSSPSAVNRTRTGDALDPVTDAVAGSRAATRVRFRDPERYQIIGEHGRGGLGRVSRARDLDLGRDIAIKEMISRGQVSEARFVREALITARLQHPGIVPLYEAGRWPDGTPFYAMKLVAGRPLRELIAERTTVEQRIGLLHHVIAVADAIAYAHDRNIIHRDLKPANVIVGDFGETIVIDWGLAKDLSTADESVVCGGPFRVAADPGLTVAGDVLGTPTYMAPEQERGEHVDRRADVFAIGAMLWELCSLHKVPPNHIGQRHRLLRRAGIDPDLVIIIDKALEPDPSRRYPDAGALAADIKAFKSGARIAARRYSLLAMLGHWVRRHRALAGSVVAAIALAGAGSTLYVRNIATERDRAEASNNRLILEHAELLLRSDPTAAFDLLDAYRGADVHRLAMLRAEARGLGLSYLRVRPHTLSVLFAQPLADRSLVTLSADGTVAKTTPAGVHRVIARGIPAPYAFDYDAHRRLLAYACNTASICLLDVEAETTRPSPSDGAPITPLYLAFSPRGDLLAAISADGNATIWPVSGGRAASPRYQTRVPGARSIIFVDENTVAVQTPEHVELVHLDARAPTEPVQLPVAAASRLDSSSDHQIVVLGTEGGALIIIDSRSNQIVRQETVCKGNVNKVLVVTARAGIAYACQDGDAGIWDLEQNKLTVLAYMEGGVVSLAGAVDGRYLLMGSNNGKLLAYDFTTQMLSSYLGHATRLTELLPSSTEFPYILSGDSSGAVRTWSPPQAVVRVAIKTAAPMIKAMLLPNNGPLIAIGATATIPWSTRDGISGFLQGHDPSRMTIAVSPTESRFAMYGDDDEIEVWSFEPHSTNHKLKLDHSAVYTAAYTSDGTHLVSGSRDGTLTEWSNDGVIHRDLASIHEPVHFIRSLSGTDTLVVGGASRTLWLVTRAGVTQLGIEADRITFAVCSYDAKWLAVGTVRGVVRLYNLLNRESSIILTAETWIDSMMFSRDNASLAVATKNKVILLSMIEAPVQQSSPNGGVPWQEVDLSVRYVTFSPDSNSTWLAVTCDHGDVWFYRRRDNHWVYLSVGTAKVGFGKFSDDGAYFSASDSSGRALLIDMRAKTFE
jgi:eukaryotic-like serine/threonine-protein kinase